MSLTKNYIYLQGDDICEWNKIYNKNAISSYQDAMNTYFISSNFTGSIIINTSYNINYLFVGNRFSNVVYLLNDIPRIISKEKLNNMNYLKSILNYLIYYLIYFHQYDYI